MALPASGAISMGQVNTELTLSATAQISLNDAEVRALFGVASGPIKLSDGYGKASAPAAPGWTPSSRQLYVDESRMWYANPRICWNGSQFLLAVTDDAPDPEWPWWSGMTTQVTHILSSPNGVTWTEILSSAPFAFDYASKALCWTGSNYIACANGGIWSSTNGVDWPQIAAYAPVTHLCWAGSQFVGFNYYSNNYYTSPDGVTWTHGGSFADTPISLCYAAGAVVVFDRTTTAYTSTDGISWTVLTTTAPLSASGVCWTGAYFYAVNDIGDAYRSLDGITWATDATGVVEPGYIYSNDVCCGGAKLVAAGTYSSTAIRYSPNI